MLLPLLKEVLQDYSIEGCLVEGLCTPYERRTIPAAMLT